MPSLKDIRTRISSVKKTKQITSAMKLVAAAKLRRASERATAARPYRDQLENVLRRVAAAAGEDLDEPLLQSREELKRVLVVVISSDRGLCGPFNNALLRQTNDWLAEKRKSGVELDIKVYGRKAQAFFKRTRTELVDQVTDYGKTPKMELVEPLTRESVAGFIDGKYDEVWLVYNRFVNTLVQKPTFDKVLPLTVEKATEAGEGFDSNLEYRYEPAAAEILGELLPLFLQTLVLGSFLETEAGFYAAQMTAMDNATRNASDLIDRLTLEYNRARQAAITKELIEIVSGASAL